MDVNCQVTEKGLIINYIYGYSDPINGPVGLEHGIGNEITRVRKGNEAWCS